MGPGRCSSSWSNDFDGNFLRDCASVYGTRRRRRLPRKLRRARRGLGEDGHSPRRRHGHDVGKAFLLLGSNFQRASPGGRGRRCALPYSILMYIYRSRVFFGDDEISYHGGRNGSEPAICRQIAADGRQWSAQPRAGQWAAQGSWVANRRYAN
jgi:hypothetical protein